MTKKICTYFIQCIENGRVYVGASESIERRKEFHFLKLKRNTHHSKLLQEDYNKYGAQAFVFKIMKTFNMRRGWPDEGYDRHKAYALETRTVKAIHNLNPNLLYNVHRFKGTPMDDVW